MTNSGEIMFSPRSIKGFDVVAGSAANDTDDEPATLHFRLFGCPFDPWRRDNRKNIGRPSTLIRHAASLALAPLPLAVPVIEFSFGAFLVFSVGFLAL